MAKNFFWQHNGKLVEVRLPLTGFEVCLSVRVVNIMNNAIKVKERTAKLPFTKYKKWTTMTCTYVHSVLDACKGVRRA